MNAPAKALAQSSTLANLKIVDADTHISEWPDLWTSRAPARFRDLVPQLKELNGRATWVIDGDTSLGSICPSSAIRRDGSKANGIEFIHWDLADVHRGSYEVNARLEYMDSVGITAQIAYPNVLGFGGQRAIKVDANLRLVSVQLFNDAMAEFQENSGNRIFPMALLPWWDVDLAVAEVERCAAMGLRGVNTNPDPHTHGLPEMGDDYWAPLWESLSDKGMPVNFHIGASDESSTWYGSGFWPSFNQDTQLAFGSTMMFLSNSRVLTNIIMSRFLERFPKLKIVSVESGVGWLPFLIEALEYQMKESNVPFTVPPREIFRRQIYACSWFERRDLATDARSLGIDNVLFETDFPHPTCLYPDVVDHMEKAAEMFTPEERRKVFGGNAIGVYNLPI